MDSIDKAVKNLRVLWMSLLAVIVGYVFILLWLHPAASQRPNRTLILALGFCALTEIPVMLFFRQSFVGKSAAKLRENSSDAAALTKFRTGYIASFCLCFAIALYGLVLGVLGTRMIWVAPFFAVGFVLLLMIRPVLPAES